MKDYVEATERVTGILIRLDAGETVSPRRSRTLIARS